MKDNITQAKLSDLPNILSRHINKKTFYVADKTVFEIYSSRLNISENEMIFFLQDAESEKTLEKYEECLSFFIEANIRRDSHIVAIGGGATIDFAGFIAATILRGITWSAIPTSLLAMVDACIGGKVGLNMPQAKNLIGAFHSPEMVYICHEFLETLSKPEVDSGMGEIIKYAFLSTEINRLIKKDAPLPDIVFRCLKYKKEITDKDFREENDRRVLNFGHTLGHAFERDMKMAHGLAVVLGIYHTIKSFHHDLLSELYSLMDSLKISKNILHPRPNDIKRFWSFVEKDKKNTEDGIQLILLKSLGHPTIQKMTIDELKSKISFE